MPTTNNEQRTTNPIPKSKIWYGAGNESIFRIIDANLNRTREGLRVCEDITRFVIRDKDIAKALKLIRHAATRTIVNSKKPPLKSIIQTRNVKKDTLRFSDFKKRKGVSIFDIFMSNIERVKESLRVLEECFKVIDEKISGKYRNLRFNTYNVERKFAEKAGYISSNRQRGLKR